MAYSQEGSWLGSISHRATLNSVELSLQTMHCKKSSGYETRMQRYILHIQWRSSLSTCLQLLTLGPHKKIVSKVNEDKFFVFIL